MFKLSNKYVLRQEMNTEGGDGGGSGGGSGGGDEFTQEQYKELLVQNESMKSQTVSMKNKMDELLGEAKHAKSERRKADETAQAAVTAKAQKDGDFKQLFESSELRSSGFQAELTELRGKISKEKQGGAAMKIAASIADGPDAEILATFIEGRLRHTDEGMKVLDGNGQLTVSTMKELTNEFQNNARYASLLRGNQSSGGGATGGQKIEGGSAAKEITRSEFETMSPDMSMKFILDGGKLTL